MAQLEIIEKLECIVNSISELKNQTEKIYSTKEAAEYLNISLPYLYKLTSQGLIGHHKPGGKKIKFTQTDLDVYQRRNRVKPIWEIEHAAANFCESSNSKNNKKRTNNKRELRNSSLKNGVMYERTKKTQ
jgi:excisionase family DNA binding protein